MHLLTCNYTIYRNYYMILPHYYPVIVCPISPTKKYTEIFTAQIRYPLEDRTPALPPTCAMTKAMWGRVEVMFMAIPMACSPSSVGIQVF